ncbi:MAG: hypothetical protein ACYTEQ_30970, partial [Planctomycetota bacterium]
CGGNPHRPSPEVLQKHYDRIRYECIRQVREHEIAAPRENCSKWRPDGWLPASLVDEWMEGGDAKMA